MSVLDLTGYEVELPKSFANYDRVLNLAAKAARQFQPMSYIVYYDNTSLYLRPADVPKPLGAIVECIAQAWDAKTIQLRFRGARSEWRYV